MNDATLRAYLLGQAPTTEAERLEERFLEDHEVFETLRACEDELFDDYARDRLTADERRQFLERYGADADRLQFARAVGRRGALDPPLRPGRFGAASPKARFVAVRRSTWIPLAAAAALLIAVGGALWLRPPPAAAVAGREPVPVPAPARAPAPAVVALLTIGTSRAASNASSVTLPLDAPALQLRVRLDPADRFDWYAMALRSPADQIVWRTGDLQATRDGSELLLVAEVPATALAGGSYELAVRGGSTSAMDDLGFVTVKVNKTP